MNIKVNNKDLGFFTQTYITAQVFETINEDKYLSFCNHANAKIEKIENQIDRADQPDICWTTSILVCDKPNCGAYRLEGEEFWQDAPSEGLTLEMERHYGE